MRDEDENERILFSLSNKLGNGSVKVRDLGLLFPFSLTWPGRVEEEINSVFTNPHT